MTENIDANGGGDWRAGLPDDLKESPALKDFKDVGGLAKSFIDTQKKLGERPSSWNDLDAPTEPGDRAKAYARLGRPDSPDGYKLPADTDARDFRLAAHKNNLTAEQAEGLFKDITEGGKVAKEAADARYAETLAEAERKTREAYEAKWGEQYEENNALVAQAMEKFIPEDGRQMIESLGLQNEPWLIDIMHTMGKAMSEDQLLGGGGSGGDAGGNLEAVRAKRIAMDNDPEYRKIVNNAWHPQYKEKTEEYARLMSEEARMATKDGTVQPWGPQG